MGYGNAPKRVVLRFNVRYELEEREINQSFLNQFGYEANTEYFSHLTAPNRSSKMHIVLDFYHITNPAIDNRKVVYEVYSVVKRDNKFEFRQLDSDACKLARERCKRVGWGTHRSQSDEFDGDLPSHVGHLPDIQMEAHIFLGSGGQVPFGNEYSHLFLDVEDFGGRRDTSSLESSTY